MGLQKIKDRVRDLFLTNENIKVAEPGQETHRFHFQPFEIEHEFDGKPHGFSKAFWQNEERRFALAIADGWVRFCEVDKLESGQWNFAIASRIPRLSNHTKVNPDFVENVFQTALKNQEFGRLFRFDVDKSDEYDYDDWETEVQWVFIGAENQGIIEFNEQRAYFEYQTSLSLTESSIAEWYAEIEKWCGESESDFSFLFRWNKSNIEKAWLINYLLNGTRTEMETIASLILSLEDTLLKEARTEHAERIAAKISIGTRETRAELRDIGFTDWYDDDIAMKPIRSELWEVFLRYFEPQIDPQILEKYLPSNFKGDYPLVFVAETQEPTAHQQLELRLQLAEWLQGKVPDDQIDSLLA